ncbi:unnamed protein product [Adineta ricciae]|uniref:Uncharacterized protein n=1 Tax=Adineta ricciae TaxID=249248 RepID=A0A816AG60_ADIRI|nr:unnamed protein product [Adineta ricciae]CAF1597230.1 unnamed protein product [Adineta ricciae]
MVFIFMTFLVFGLVNGNANRFHWYELPNAYLGNFFVREDTLRDSLGFAAWFDPYFKNEPNLGAAIDRCENHNLRRLFISPDQAAAITCYTSGTRLPTSLNYALRSLDKALITAWTPYLQFFHLGVQNLPEETPPELCRGDPFVYSAVNHSYVTLPLSWSNSAAYCDMRSYASGGPCTKIILLQPFRSTKRLDTYASFDEKEWITLPGTVGQIQDIIPQNGGVCRIIRVRQVNPIQVS